MKTITLDIPDTLELDALGAKSILASNLFEQGKLSLGQAAEFAGVDKRMFMESLSAHGVSVFNEASESLDTDLKNAQDYHR